MTRSERRRKIAELLRRRVPFSLRTLADTFEVSMNVIQRDLQVLRRRQEADTLEGRGMLCERMRHLSRQAEADGDVGAAIRAEQVLGRLLGHLQPDVSVSATASASAETTFEELSRRAAEELDTPADNRLAGLVEQTTDDSPLRHEGTRS